MLNIFRSILNNFGSTGNDIQDNASDNSKNDCTTECVDSLTSTEISRKQVKFYHKIRVVLVPCAAEYHEAGCDLWWSEIDYHNMRESFREEIEETLRKDPTLQNNLYCAMKKLYQPSVGESSIEDCSMGNSKSLVSTDKIDLGHYQRNGFMRH